MKMTEVSMEKIDYKKQLKHLYQTLCQDKLKLSMCRK